ncbi:unnamed protein product [Chilo suppressalis]|uniref:SAM domain-containing protein n=1 Tax=Chilo suppressalis TaxID=168631 RepID=A0ABN8B4D6_CHISP|nr:unnamed protein product [Chilo suppressalis]
MDEADNILCIQKSEAHHPRQRAKKNTIPRREPSIVIPERQIVYITPDKTTCAECACFPKEDPYVKLKKLNPCQKSPITLYELAAKVVDALRFPAAFSWSVEEVAEWIENIVGLPQYRECILDNHVNGMRLLMLEDPSHLPAINVHDFKHIQRITKSVRREFGMEFIRFCRSIGLPPQKPLTHCTWFKSRTGPNWGIRQNWTRCDVLRWMKILNPAPVHRDHWDLVWYRKPDYPKVKFARVKAPPSQLHIPHYAPPEEDICREYQAPRKFKLCKTDEVQLIWLEHRPGSDIRSEVPETKTKTTVPKETKLMPKKLKLEGLKGKDLLLARRRMPKPKF